MKSMTNRQTRMAVLLITMTLLLGASLSRSYARDDSRYDRDRDRYVFAATRSVNQMDSPTALKVPLLPVAVILDLLFLPIAALADAMAD